MGQGRNAEKNTTNSDWKKNTCKLTGLDNVLRMSVTTLVHQENPRDGCTFI